MDNEKNKAATAGAIALIVGLVAGFLIGWYWYKGVCQRMGVVDTIVNETENTNNTNGTSTSVMGQNTTTSGPTITTAPAGSEKITVSNQKAGSTVTVSQVNTSGVTWVAVREILNGQVGNILGARRIQGNTSNVEVSLLRATKTGGTYRVVLYKDNGDAAFNSKADVLINGVTADFKAQ